MTKRNVMINIQTTRFTVNRSLFGGNGTGLEEDLLEEALDLPDEDGDGDLPDSFELLMEGRLVTTTHRVELLYEESELTGAVSSLSLMVSGILTAVLFPLITKLV